MSAINQLKLPQMFLDPQTGKFIEVSHESLTIGHDLEMDRVVQLRWFENNNGQPGLPTLQVIDNDAEMHEELKRRLRDQFKTRSVATTTRTRMVNPQTGASVEPVEGQYPAGSISSLEFWQNVPRALVVQNDDGTISQSVYAALAADMQTMVNNGLIF